MNFTAGLGMAGHTVLDTRGWCVLWLRTMELWLFTLEGDFDEMSVLWLGTMVSVM